MTVDDVDNECEYEVLSSTNQQEERPRRDHDDDDDDDVKVVGGKGWFDVYYVEEIKSLCCLSRSGSVVTVRIPFH